MTHAWAKGARRADGRAWSPRGVKCSVCGGLMVAGGSFSVVKCVRCRDDSKRAAVEAHKLARDASWTSGARADVLVLNFEKGEGA